MFCLMLKYETANDENFNNFPLNIFVGNNLLRKCEFLYLKHMFFVHFKNQTHNLSLFRADL